MENVEVYGVGDLRPALETIGATTRQLSYLVTKGVVTPSVRLPGRLGYTKEDLGKVFLILGPLAPLDAEARRTLVSAVEYKLFKSRSKDEFIELDLEDAKKDRNPAVKLKLDRLEILHQFTTFMAAVGC